MQPNASKINKYMIKPTKQHQKICRDGISRASRRRAPAWEMQDCGRPYASGSLVPTRKPREVHAPRRHQEGKTWRRQVLLPSDRTGEGEKEGTAPSPGAGPGTRHCVRPGMLSPRLCQVWACCEHRAGTHHLLSCSASPPQLRPLCLTFPTLICLPVRPTQGSARSAPPESLLTVAVAEQPGPGAPKRRKKS